MKIENVLMWRRQYWFGVVALLLTGLVVVANVPVWAAPSAAPLGQTIPLPTATSRPSELPTATPSNDDSDDDDDDASSQPDPAETPDPDSLPAAVDPGAGLVGNVDDLGITGEVVVERLNVRDGPGADFELVGTLASGEIVALLARNADGAWWALCCVGEQGLPGWASAQFIKPSIGRADVNSILPVVASLDDLFAGIVMSSPAQEAAGSAAAGQAETSVDEMTQLLLEMRQSPPYVLQGGQVDLTLVVTNVGETDAAAVVLSDQLPDGLAFVEAEIDAGGTITQDRGDGDALVITGEWPQLAAGESATIVLTLAVAADYPSGAVIDNLAAVVADNAQGANAGISIGTVPTLLPDF